MPWEFIPDLIIVPAVVDMAKTEQNGFDTEVKKPFKKYKQSIAVQG
jgi:hypothetical protein